MNTSELKTMKRLADAADELANFLEEAHAADVADHHAGDAGGSRSCSYCRAIRQTRAAIKKVERLDMAASLLGALLCIANGDGCTCEDHSWYGPDHDSECPVGYARLTIEDATGKRVSMKKGEGVTL